MLLLHQAGSVKIGEVVRYTVTYTPAHDRILPSPSTLSLKIRNTSALALRAAFIHGPYTLYAAAYPSTFSPNTKFENPRREGVPEFEPNLKAGGSFSCQLAVPANVRESAGTSRHDGRGWDSGDGEKEVRSVSWIIEVSSQVIFSNSAAVHYEILLGRDERSLNLGLLGNSGPAPGQVSDHQQSAGARDGRHAAQVKGVYSKAIRVRVDDTASLWNTPRMPGWDQAERGIGAEETSSKGNKDTPVDSVMEGKDEKDEGHRQKRQKKVHLVVLTHGLHSNLGADMLYLKESIDATAKQAKMDAKARRAKWREEERRKSTSAGQEQHEGERREDDGSTKAPVERREDDMDDEDDEEEVIVRGFSGNAVRTERGIKYLGKRLAKYVLNMTYPDQPYRPLTKSATGVLSHALKQDLPKDEPLRSHKDSTIIKSPYKDKELAYKVTSISFIAHSLGGLIQTYAVAYIQKHSPEFFDIIKPINFIAMASPFLGLSNENPLYVKFALDFGLVGRTGQDLGLTWRAPTIARSGWGAIVGGIGESAHKKIDRENTPEAKPLLRILPTGPAHTVLKKFRNRTVYSNVVNDGIVPLRTSCLLFLDWQGLGRVEKARRENGLVGTMAEWGWAELTGANSNYPSSPRHTGPWSDGTESDDDTGANTPTRQGHGADVPQPPVDATDDDNARGFKNVSRSAGSSVEMDRNTLASPTSPSAPSHSTSPLASFFGLFKPNTSQKQSHTSHVKAAPKIFKRSQTIKIESESSTPSTTSFSTRPSSPRGPSKASTGDDEHENPSLLSAPPTTTFFESAGDLLKPPLPSVEFLINPSSRPRTIFHDRVYHPSDIPPPPMKKRTVGIMRRLSSSNTGISTPVLSSPHSPNFGIFHESSELSTKDYDDTEHTNPHKDPLEVVDGSAMKVEEKIARAYHRDLSWRKVLVRLEPDAHNNMIVRRMFANAYGWPVVKHLVDTHFSDAAIASTRDVDQSNAERAKSADSPTSHDGAEVKSDDDNKSGDDRGHMKMPSNISRTNSEVREATDEVPALNPAPKPGSLGKVLAGNLAMPNKPWVDRHDSSGGSVSWSDRDWADSGDDSDSEMETNKSGSGEASSQQPREKASRWNWTEAIAGKGAGLSSPRGSNMAEIERFLSAGSHSDAAADTDTKPAIDSSTARVLSGETADKGVPLGVEALPIEEGDGEGVSERVAKLDERQG